MDKSENPYAPPGPSPSLSSVPEDSPDRRQNRADVLTAAIVIAVIAGSLFVLWLSM
jgi:hypothetical protein